MGDEGGVGICIAPICTRCCFKNDHNRAMCVVCVEAKSLNSYLLICFNVRCRLCVQRERRYLRGRREHLKLRINYTPALSEQNTAIVSLLRMKGMGFVTSFEAQLEEFQER